jgi:hypothetical protein
VPSVASTVTITAVREHGGQQPLLRRVDAAYDTAIRIYGHNISTPPLARHLIGPAWQRTLTIPASTAPAWRITEVAILLGPIGHYRPAIRARSRGTYRS